MTLDMLPPRRRAEIVAVDWAALAPDEAKRLQALGLDCGARVAITLAVGRMTVAVRRSHARAMTVELL